MKKLLLVAVLVITAFAQAQDYAFMETLRDIKTPEAAKTIAETFAGKLKGKFVYYKTKEFDHGLLRIVFAPEGMTEEAIKAQSDYEDCFVMDFKVINDANGKSYNFNKGKARYDALFPVWKQLFKPDAATDKKTQRVNNPEKGLLFSFINTGDVWAIGR